MTRRWKFALGMVAALGVTGCCQLRTTYDSKTTTVCMAEATAPDAGPPDMLQTRDRCEDCCRRHGLSGVEPGYCSCGTMGLDALMK